MKHEDDSETKCGWCIWNNHQTIGKGTEGLWNKRTSGAYPDSSIIKIGQNAEKRPRDLRRFVVIQNPVRNY